MRTEKVDVSIVGAGPAGSIAAERLAREGVQVFLCDRQNFPRYKCCAAGVLWHDIEDFPEIKPVIENYNHAMIVHPPSLSREFKIESQEHYIMGQTYRATLDAHLANLAKKAGADFRDGTRVDDVLLLDNKSGISLKVHDKKDNEDFLVESRLVIGAGGVTSIVRKKHPEFPEWQKKEILIACELDVPLPEKKITDIFGNEHTVHAFLYFDNLPGYAWIFTKKKSLSLGMGTMLEFQGKTLGGKILKEKFEGYCKYLVEHEYIPEGSYNLNDTQYALIPSTSLKKSKTHANNALLAGDAAGAFTSALSGEGIYYSMLSGKFAAMTAKNALDENKYDAQTLSLYPKLWLKRLKSELNYQYFAKTYMLENKRRCEKAIRWGLKDKKIRDFMTTFLTGAYDIDRSFLAKLIFHYIRLKAKDALGLMGEREKKKDYKS